MCRSDIEEDKPSKTKAINLELGVDLIKEEMEIMNIEEHVEAITLFDSPGGSFKNALRLFGLSLMKSVIAYQNEDENELIWEEDEEEE